MSNVDQERWCPLCENIVPREVPGVAVKISHTRKLILHEGCAKAVYNAVEILRITEVEEEEE